MALIEPFRALRYAPHLAEAIADVIAPPYDVISTGLQQTLHDRHAANFIRLEYAQDHADADRYERAGATLDAWIRDGILVREDSPAYYVYEQSFRLPEGVDAPDDRGEYRRRAVFAAVELEPCGGTIYPHEKTMPGPKADRLRLMDATCANLSPVFSIASDEDRSIDKALADAAGRGRLLYDGTDDQEQTHRLWRVDGAAAADLRETLTGASLTIADGHHRYETALAHRDQVGGDRAGAPAGPGSVMMSIVSSRSDELVILPTYRLLSGLDAEAVDTLPRRLAEGGHIVRQLSPDGGSSASDIMLAAVRAPDPPTFGLCVQGGACHTVGRPAGDAAAHGLDVAYLHERLLPEYLGVDTDDPSGQAHVRYTVSRERALDAVASGEAQAAVFVRGVTMAEVEKVARSGGTMPQKSTYFYPKMPSGLVTRRLDE